MTKRVYFFFWLCVVCHGPLVEAQDLDWAGSIFGHGIYTFENYYPGSSQCNAIAVDEQENVYIAGSFNDTIDLDLGPGELFLTFPENCLFIAKYDALGNVIWGRMIQPLSQGNERVTGIAIDNAGNVVLTGGSSGRLDLDPGPGIASVPDVPADASNFSYFYIAKYDPNGALIWYTSTVDGHGQSVYDLTIDAQDNILVIGKFYNWVDIDPSPTSDTLQGNIHSLFFAKYAGDGSFQWANGLSRVGAYGEPSCIRTDAQGSVYISGSYAQTVDFDPGPGVFEMTASSSFSNPFFAKYDALGALVWAKGLEFGNGQGADGIELALDSSGTIYLAGDFYGPIDMDPGPGEVLVSSNDFESTYFGKYTNSGDLIWAERIPGSFEVSKMAVNDYGDILLAGTGSGDFDPGPGIAWVTGTVGAFNDFWAKYDPDGNYCWARVIGNNGISGGVIEPTFAILGDHQYMAGSFKQTGDFDPSNSEFPLSASANGTNAYLARYSGEHYTLDLGTDITLCDGNLVELGPDIPDAIYLWSDGSSGELFTTSESGTYWVQATTHDCILTDTIHVEFNDCNIALEMPNVFSPNGDGSNDRFLPIRANGIGSSSLEIHNRWGNEVYRTGNALAGWDGKNNGTNCSSGVYFYVVRYTGTDGVERELNGHLTLIRGS